MRWRLPPDPPLPPELLAAAGSPRAARLLALRGVTDPEQVRGLLDPAAFTPTPPAALPDLELAAERIEQAIAAGEHLGVWGDFDVDGQTATTLLVGGLRSLGGQVSYHIPVRAKESHGLNIPNLDRLLDAGVQLLITCDTGSQAHAEVAHAQGRGVPVIITDHHDLGASLPPAVAIVNPKRLPAGHPLSSLPGVAVAYKLLEALLASVGRADELDNYLDLVALGLVADVALLQGEARYLLQRGLAVLRNTDRAGLRELYRAAGIDPQTLNEETIGFTIGPRLNALGRLGDANPMVEFLTGDDLIPLRVLATQLEGLNAQRRLLTSQVLAGALAQIERQPELLDRAALVLHHPDWPGGVVGIVASQLVERFGRPAVLLTGGPDDLLRGSARGLAGLDISAAIASQAPLLASYGGHPMAAGVSLPHENLPDFRVGLSRALAAQRGETAWEGELAIDLELPLADVTLELAQDLARLAPFGAGWPAPTVVCRALRLHGKTRHLGRSEEHLGFTVIAPDGTTRPVVWWSAGELPEQGTEFDLVFRPAVRWKDGQAELQLVYLGARVTAEVEPPVDAPPPELIDLRQSRDPVSALAELLAAEPGAMVWAEVRRPATGGRSRDELMPARTLVLWSQPPSWRVLRRAVEQVLPSRVVVVGLDPEIDQLDNFLERLAGLGKYAMTREDGRMSLKRLAAAMAHTRAAVRLGLAWLVAQGSLAIQDEQGDQLVLAPGTPASRFGDVLAVQQELLPLLREAAAFRAYLLHADLESFFKE